MIAQKTMLPASLRLAGTASRVALLALTAFSFAGCSLMAKKDKEEVTASIPVDYRQRHPITIRDADHQIEVFVGSRRGGLTASQRSDVEAFALTWRREATGGIAIDIPSGTPNARAAADAAREARAALAAAGVPPQSIAVRPYRPQNHEQLATVRLRYPKMKAEAGPCGLWPEDLGLPHDAQPTMNRPYWNLGCSSQRNLAAMVDNPADLAQPRGDAPIYSPRRNTALDKYRRGESSATVYPDATKGKISDVGQ